MSATCLRLIVFPLSQEPDAAATFQRIFGTVRQGWRDGMQRAGVARADCERIASAFVYSGLTQIGDDQARS